LLDIDKHPRRNFDQCLKQIFLDERVAYTIINHLIVPLISDVEVEEVNSAIQGKYDQVTMHIKKAIELYRKRPMADYENSIKESISAIEALAKIVLKRQRGTLGNLVEHLNIHSALKEGVKKLYGWTSDESGVRHAAKNIRSNIDETEARFMLIQSSALVNYIIAKHETKEV